jgi:hypothetical protein
MPVGVMVGQGEAEFSYNFKIRLGIAFLGDWGGEGQHRVSGVAP